MHVISFADAINSHAAYNHEINPDEADPNKTLRCGMHSVINQFSKHVFLTMIQVSSSMPQLVNKSQAKTQ
jgi:hypothetical protein